MISSFAGAVLYPSSKIIPFLKKAISALLISLETSAIYDFILKKHKKNKYDNIKLLINKLNNYNLITLLIFFLFKTYEYNKNNDIRLINNINMINNINYYKHEIF